MCKTSATHDLMEVTPPSAPPSPSFENVLDELGMPGRFQITQIVVIFLSITLSSWVGMAFVFQGYVPPHECKAVNQSQLLSKSKYGLRNDSKIKVTYEACDLTISVNHSSKSKMKDADVDMLNCPYGRNFSDVYKTTWVSEWDLVCESKGRAEFSFSMFTIGQIVGGVIASHVTDKFGRKPVLMAVTVIGWLLETAIIFAPNIYVIIAIKFGSGFCQRSMLICGYVYGIELVAPRHRHIYGPCTGFLWVPQVLAMGAAAYALKDFGWQYFQIVMSATGIFVLVGFLCLEESPRWLAANGRAEEALVILRKASKQNGKDFQKIKEVFVAYVNQAFPSTDSTNLMIPLDRLDSSERCSATPSADSSVNIKTNKISLPMLFTNRYLLIPTCIMTTVWLANVLTYYGLYMTASKLAGDRFLNFALMVLVSIPSYFFVLLILRKFGRRVSISFCLAMTGVCLTASTLIDIFGNSFIGSEVMTTVFFISGTWTISASICVTYIMTPELYPTNLRSTASGFCNSVARVGSMVAPYMGMLYDIISWGPCLIFTVMSVAGAVLVMFLPETRGKDLPNTLQELVEQRKTCRREESS